MLIKTAKNDPFPCKLANVCCSVLQKQVRISIFRWVQQVAVLLAWSLHDALFLSYFVLNDRLIHSRKNTQIWFIVLIPIYTRWKSSLIIFHETDSKRILLFSTDQISLTHSLKWCCKKHSHARSQPVIVHNSCLRCSSTAQFSCTGVYKRCKSTEGCTCPIDIHCKATQSLIQSKGMSDHNKTRQWRERCWSQGQWSICYSDVPLCQKEERGLPLWITLQNR